MDRSRCNVAWHWSQLTALDATLYPALVSSVLCWLAFPPVGWAVMVWFAPIGWLALVAREKLAGRHPYRKLWLAGFVFWLLTVHWIRLPHAANYLAWVSLAGYLGVYLPCFVALSRIGVHRLRLPLWLVAPVVWTGLDWLRGNLMTGFLMGSLAHTQVGFPIVIQIASLCGEYGVTFLIVLVASCLTQSFLSCETRFWHIFFDPRCSLRLLIPAALAVGMALMYGGVMLIQHDSLPSMTIEQRGPRIALIQGNTLADWKGDPDKQQSIMQEYARLSNEAVEQSRQRDGRNVDLFIWPETAYRYPLFSVAENYQPPAARFPELNLNAAQRDLAELVRRTESAILTGIDRVNLFPDEMGQPDYEQFNSSVLINRQGAIVGTYDKMHLVIMGEYVPFTRWFPLLKQLTPISGLATAGQHPQSLEFDGLVYCPNICYETAVPHLIRRHVTELAESGAAPDVLVNLTNDAWFWGSSELEMHLACGIFRAVEMRRPLVIAANGGLSAHVDSYGNVQQVTPRQQTATLLVDLPGRASNNLTFYAVHGDWWFAGLCVICCLALAITGRRSQGK